MNDYMVRAVVKGAVRTFEEGNKKDLVENTIDVVFEPAEKAARFIDSIFRW